VKCISFSTSISPDRAHKDQELPNPSSLKNKKFKRPKNPRLTEHQKPNWIEIWVSNDICGYYTGFLGSWCNQNTFAVWVPPERRWGSLQCSQTPQLPP